MKRNSPCGCSKNEIMARYANVTDATQDYMGDIIDYLIPEYGEVAPHWLGQLDSLALNYELLNLSWEQVDRDGITVTNRFGGVERHPCLKVIVDAQTQLQKLYNGLGLNPSARGKIREKGDGSDEEKLIKQLLN